GVQTCALPIWMRGRLCVSASLPVSTSSATHSRSRIRVILLQAQHLLLALQPGLDGADRGLRAVDGEVVGDVLRDGGAPDGGRVLARPAVLRRVEDEGDLAALHEVDDVGPVA